MDDDVDDLDDLEEYEVGDTYDRCDLLTRLVTLMRLHGWATRCVAETPGWPAHAYTVGLFEYEAPELIVFGLPPLAADGLLGRIAGRARGGERFTHGQVLDDLYPDFRVALLDVADAGAHLPDAESFVEPVPPRQRRLRAWQVVYPDGEGRWPWQPESRAAGQPLLGLVPPGL